MKTPSSIQAIDAFNDNYIWLIKHENQACVVDPGDAEAVLNHLNTHKLTLNAILITHWHPDHIGGIEALLKQFPSIEIYAPSSPHIPTFTKIVKQGDKVQLFDLCFNVIEVPGHTLEHVVYSDTNKHLLFSGDTLFAGGCGRVFEGTYAQMHSSLKKLAALPPSTHIYCAHEYTLSNLAFCLQVESENNDIKDRISYVSALRKAQTPSVPSLLSDELKTNVFLRTASGISRNIPEKYLNSGSDELATFTALREWKNNA